ncbi:polysaccharide pyruvyl transferase family protein [Sphingobacterium sp. MYb388]|uniref:polysaccharide pyruvyl transferase family protein n=1 Tax=Sphingobacterium sp. MYb388 TaxID=2745437 RepID=UPI0030949453
MIVRKFKSLFLRIKCKVRKLVIFYKSIYCQHGNEILLIPPTLLNGSFGDELMVVSFLEKYKDRPVTLYTQKVIIRSDLFKSYSNLSYLPWSVTPNYYKYNSCYVLGADNMSGTYGNEEVLEKTSILKEANRHKLSTSILGFSLSSKTTDIVKKEFKEISSFTSFYLRESDSYARASEFLPEDKISLVADLAFNCPLVPCENLAYTEWIKHQKFEGKLIVAICPNSIHMRGYQDEAYVDQYIDCLKIFAKIVPTAFVLLYHDIRDLNKGWDDKKISNAIFKKIGNSLSVFFPEEIQNGIELKAFLPFVDMTLTSRMHFGISGISLGKPMFGITYENKFSGLQRFFEIDPDRSLVDYKNLEQVEHVLPLFLQDLEQNRIKLQNHLLRVRELSNRNFQH